MRIGIFIIIYLLDFFFWVPFCVHIQNDCACVNISAKNRLIRPVQSQFNAFVVGIFHATTQINCKPNYFIITRGL